MKINITTDKIIDNIESENYVNSSVARIALSGSEKENVSLSIAIRNDENEKIGFVSITLKNGEISIQK